MDGSRDDLYVGSPTEDGGIRVQGPLSPRDAQGYQTDIQSQGDFAIKTHAGNLGQAILKLIANFVNRDRFVEKK